MGLILLLGLGLSANFPSPADFPGDSKGVLTVFNGPDIEQHLLALKDARPGWAGMDLDLLPHEEFWLSRLSLSISDDEPLAAGTRTSRVLRSEGLRSGESEGLFALRSTAPTFHLGGMDSPERLALRFLLIPLDLVVGLENVHVNWGNGVPQVSVSTDLPGLMDSMGIVLGRNTFLGVNLDMRGFEDTEGSGLPVLDARHASARISYLSTALGLTLKF